MEPEQGEPMESKQAAPAAGAGGGNNAVLEMDRKLEMIEAWEESQKRKAENKAAKKMSAIMAWENTKLAAVVGKMRSKGAKLDKEAAQYEKKMRKEAKGIHKAAEKKRASVLAKRHEAILKYQNMAAKHRSKGTTPDTRFLGCF